jgi:acyl dehydratase
MSTLALYARAALPLIPGASHLPFVAGGGKQMPALERTREGVKIDPAHLAQYARVCGFTLRDELPPTYLHVQAFPLHMSLMTDGRFPFPAVGLVHLENRITVHRPALATEQFDLRVTATEIEPHPKGKTFAILSEARVGEELVWEGRSTMLRRGGSQSENADRAGGVGSDASAAPPAEAPSPSTGPARSSAGAQQWTLPGDLGRRYGSVSGDKNPIHLHQYTARLFGFPRAIAHGMWTKAHCLAALRLPDTYTVDVSFRKPIFLPSKVTFETQEQTFAVRSAAAIHLEGKVTP